MPRLSKVGAAALAAFGWTSGASPVTADFLVVAGGGGSGNGGGGAGGYRTSAGTSGGGASAEAKLILIPTQSYTVTVGAGGAAGPSGGGSAPGAGGNSVFSTITSTGGGYGGNSVNASSGGSGGGGRNQNAGGAGTANQGFAGGSGGAAFPNDAGGGGGGAGSVGGNANPSSANGTGGNGGTGVSSSITGTATFYASGGGGSGRNAQGTASAGGGGNAGASVGVAGTASTGGGGGGGAGQGQTGGSGVVIISYPAPQQFSGGVVTLSGGNIIHTFTTSGTLGPITTLNASYLIVGGGGGGGGGYPTITTGGGGGAGGYQAGSGLTIDPNSTYLVTVGAGGSAGAGGGGGSNGGAGGNSAFSLVTTASVGGGYGAWNQQVGGNGGSGGGASGPTGTSPASYAGGTGTAGQGNNGGAATRFGGAGGGGAGAVGITSGVGGVGLTSSISGTSTYYAGGGGCAGALGGLGGGGNGADYPSSTVAAGAGTAGTGGGGGGGGNPSTSGAAGGSGTVIISYPGSTQLMAGGTVTIAGGNVIHTFTSTGYLAPLDFVGNSLRFRSSASAFLNRTPVVASNRKTWTWSAWVKKSNATTNGTLFAARTAVGATYLTVVMSSAGDFRMESNSETSYPLYKTNALFRDPAAWYHFVVALDMTQATSTNRLKVWVNGVLQTTASYNVPAQNTDLAVNSTETHLIGQQASASYFDGYMTEVNFIDGQALTPNSFGTFNSYGVWQPINYAGSYGTNGFYLPFSNTTSTTTLGYDFGPQGNNWTTNNISLTAGVTYDSMTDVPTLTSTTAANYAVLNPLRYSTNGTLSEANLKYSNGSGDNGAKAIATIGIPSGKWYFEASWISGPSNSRFIVGFASSTTSVTTTTLPFERDGSNLGLAANDIANVAIDFDAGKIWYGKNNVWQASGDPATGANPVQTFTPSSYDFLYPALRLYGASDGTTVGVINFGQRPLSYTPPSGFVRLNAFNL
jgi:hypothetical protein